LTGGLGLWATFRHACHGKKIGVPLVVTDLKKESETGPLKKKVQQKKKPSREAFLYAGTVSWVLSRHSGVRHFLSPVIGLGFPKKERKKDALKTKVHCESALGPDSFHDSLLLSTTCVRSSGCCNWLAVWRQNTKKKTTTLSGYHRSIAGVPFDSVRRFRASLLLHATCDRS